MSVEKLKELEKFYGTLSAPFRVLSFDNQSGAFRIGQNTLEFPFEVVVLKEYSQYRAFNDDSKLEMVTTIEPKASMCKSLKDGTPRDELKGTYKKLSYAGWLLALIKKDNSSFEPVILILSGNPLASYIRVRRGGMTVKYTFRGADVVMSPNGDSYEIDIEVSDVNTQEADEILKFVDPNNQNNVIYTFEAYRKAYNTIVEDSTD